MRSRGDNQGYEKLKKMTQGRQLTKKDYFVLLKKLKLGKAGFDFINLTPEKYTGDAEKLTELIKNL